MAGKDGLVSEGKGLRSEAMEEGMGVKGPYIAVYIHRGGALLILAFTAIPM